MPKSKCVKFVGSQLTGFELFPLSYSVVSEKKQHRTNSCNVYVISLVQLFSSFWFYIVNPMIIDNQIPMASTDISIVFQYIKWLNHGSKAHGYIIPRFEPWCCNIYLDLCYLWCKCWWNHIQAPWFASGIKIIPWSFILPDILLMYIPPIILTYQLLTIFVQRILYPNDKIGIIIE